MELEELKNAWTALDSKLGENKKLNKRLIHGMLEKKSSKALSKLINFDLFGIVITGICIPFLIYMFNFQWLHTPILDTLMFCLLGTLVLVLFAQIYKVYLLSKIDLAEVVSKNIVFIRKYHFFIKKEQLSIVVIPLCFILMVIGFLSLEFNVELWRWIGLFLGSIICVVIFYWQYKIFYFPKIQSLQKSLDELKELEEE